jgi:membrane associated rhomboid family serine protease
MHQRPGGGGVRPRGVGLAMPKPPSAVKLLLLINVGAFILQLLLDRPGEEHSAGLISRYFGLTTDGWWQPWRYVTFQFLHTGIGHILLNMLFLYFLGGILERHWGTKRFTWFYLTCGVGAGVSYAIMGTAMEELPGNFPLIGASGGVYGILVACAVFFPHIRVLVFFLFPVSIRVVAIVSLAIMSLTVLGGLSGGEAARPPDFWSKVAHFGGVAVAGVWIALLPRMRSSAGRARTRLNQGAWKRKMQKRDEEQAEIDRILRKINEQGINSLTRNEKQTLQEATRRQQEEDRRMGGL